MDELKRKISEEFDERGSADVSNDLMKEIESSSGDLKNYADDLMKVESYLQAIRGVDLDDPDWQSVHSGIRRELEEDGMSGSDDKLLDPPMPDGTDDDVAADKEKQEGAVEEEGPRMRLTSTRLKGEAKKKEEKESSGLLNIGALVKEHRASLAPPTSGSGLDVPPTVVGTGGGPEKGGRSRTVTVAVVLGVVAVVIIAAVVGVSTIGRNNVDEAAAEPQIDREALEAELKQKILAELEAEGMIGEEAEEEAARKAQILAQAEIEKQKAAETETTAEEEAVEAETEKTASKSTYHKKRRKKHSGGGSASSSSGSAGSSEESGYTPKTTSSTATGGSKGSSSKGSEEEKPKSAADDLASLLEGGVGKKDSGDSSFLKGDGGKKTSEAAAPDPSLPKKLDKSAIRKAMNKIQPKIMQCGKNKLGTLTLLFVVSGSGSVKSVSVKKGNKFANDPAGKCAVNVARKAKFDKFQNPTQSVVYHFVFAPKPGM
jgi:outer membrane biosynthesis protein TonB